MSNNSSEFSRINSNESKIQKQYDNVLQASCS